MDAMAESVAWKLSEIKRDMEVMITANTAKVQGDNSTARKTAGFPTWILNKDAVGADPTGDGSDTATNGTQRAFVESSLLNCLAAGVRRRRQPELARGRHVQQAHGLRLLRQPVAHDAGDAKELINTSACTRTTSTR
jgi:hypothetical protein